MSQADASAETITDELPLVWLPFDPAELGDPPEGLRYEVVDLAREVPDSVGDVAFYVLPYELTAGAGEAIPEMTSLRVVQTLTAGVDHIRSAVPAGVTLCSGRGIHDTSTAELALALTLAGLRGLPDFVRAQDQGRWTQGWRQSLADKRVLLIGYGAIGKAIETRLRAFEVAEVMPVARTAREGVHALADLPELLPRADVVILVLPLTDESRGLVDADFLSRLPDGALVVNVARGPVIDQDALVAELRSGRLLAAVDVVDPEPLPADDPLWGTPGLFITPHVGGTSSAMWPRAYRLVRDQLHRFAAGEDLHNVLTGDY